MSSPTIPVPSKKILVVEDNTDVRKGIAKYLQIENYIVIQAENGKEALKALENFTPDLILSDISMPEKDGVEFYQDVRKNSQWVTIPFIFLSGDNSPEKLRRSRELGVEDYLTKPIRPRDLVNTINARLLRSAEVRVAHIGQAYLETVKVLANAIEGRDRYTRGHVDRVTRYATWMAEELRWPDHQIKTLKFGCRLHDIGKIIIPDHILNKKGKLTNEEWQLMRQHPLAGQKILRNINHLEEVSPYILYHHERWDGSGYPEGLKGRDIPLEARLLAIADIYDALTTERSYHPARPHKEVLKYIHMTSGKEVDPDLAEVFVKVMKQRYQMAA